VPWVSGARSSDISSTAPPSQVNYQFYYCDIVLLLIYFMLIKMSFNKHNLCGFFSLENFITVISVQRAYWLIVSIITGDLWRYI
jgi:heme/copper-type cytochrome/quinol oxidase subunit 4